MSNSNINLTKTCSNCGLQKPLSAFLELSGSAGANYGSICSTCRKTFIEKNNALKEPEGSTTSTTGIKIDTKAKVKGEKDRKQHWKSKEERYEEAEKKLEEKFSKQTQKAEQLVSKEKTQRERKQTIWKSGDKSKQGAPQSVFGGEQHTAKEKAIDLATGPVQDSYIPGKLKFQGVSFNALKFLLPKTAALASKSQTSTPEKKESPAQKSESLTDYTRKTWGPKK